jgi:glycosyltransferase involved in cell wall biosynthesis
VVHIVPALFGADGIYGGAERYAFELARHMADHTPTELVTFGCESRVQTAGRLKIHVINTAWGVRGQRTNPLSPSLLTKLMRADIVHCHQRHVLATSMAALLCRLLRRGVFVTDLGGGGWDVSSYFSTDRWFDGHLHISEYSRKISGHADNPAAHVIWGGVDTLKFSPDESVTRESTVLFVGRLIPHKGIENLIAALPEGCPLEIIGQPYDSRYLQHLRGLANGKQVIFRHDCDDDVLVQAYRRASCVVLPSVYRTIYGDETRVPELLGQTLLEGMACATPAICTDVASLPEVVEDGISGFLVPASDVTRLGDKIRWIIGHPTEARVMGDAARRCVLSKFTWPQVVERCLVIYCGGCHLGSGTTLPAECN